MAQRLVEIAPRALRDLRRLPSAARKQILEDFSVLETTPWPRPPKIKKLRGYELYRLRTGTYRSMAEAGGPPFEDRGQTVAILRVIDRKDLERLLRGL